MYRITKRWSWSSEESIVCVVSGAGSFLSLVPCSGSSFSNYIPPSLFFLSNVLNMLWFTTFMWATPTLCSAAGIWLFLLCQCNHLLCSKIGAFRRYARAPRTPFGGSADTTNQGGTGILKILFVDLPFSLYFGWTTVATAVNFYMFLLLTKWRWVYKEGVVDVGASTAVVGSDSVAGSAPSEGGEALYLREREWG